MDKAISYTNKDVLLEIRKAASVKFAVPSASVIEDSTIKTAAKMLFPEELEKLPDWARTKVEELLRGPDSGGFINIETPKKKKKTKKERKRQIIGPPKAKPEPKPAEEPKVKPEPAEEPKVKPEPVEEPKVKPEPVEEPKVKPEPKAKPEPEPEPKAKPEPEPVEEPKQVKPAKRGPKPGTSRKGRPQYQVVLDYLRENPEGITFAAVQKHIAETYPEKVGKIDITKQTRDILTYWLKKRGHQVESFGPRGPERVYRIVK